MIYEAITSQLPDKQETKILSSLLTEMKNKYRTNPKEAQKLCNGLTLVKPEDYTDLAAWTMVVNSLYSLDVTKTRE